MKQKFSFGIVFIFILALQFCTTPWTKEGSGVTPPMAAEVSEATMSVPLREVLADPGRYTGSNMTLVGIIKPGNEGCTEKKCDENECCNRCSADALFTIEGETGGLILVGNYQKQKIMCKGTNCGLNCIPRRGYNYRINGVVTMKGGQAYYNVNWIQSVR